MLRTRSTFHVRITQDNPDSTTDAPRIQEIEDEMAARVIRALRTEFPDAGTEDATTTRVHAYNTEILRPSFKVSVKMRAKGPSARRVERHAIVAIQGLSWCDGDASYSNRSVDRVELIGPALQEREPDTEPAAESVAAD